MGLETKWSTLPLKNQIAKTLGLIGVQFEGRILVFGGTPWSSFNMYALNEEGELLENLSEDQNIPGYMCQGAVVVIKGKLHAAGHGQVY